MRFVWIQVVVFSLFGASAFACDLPVFRYALERWPASQYGVQIIHRGPLDSEAVQAANILSQSGLLMLQSFDLMADVKPSNWGPEMMEKVTSSTAWLQLMLIPEESEAVCVWEATLNLRNATLLMGSAGRREIVNRLIKGDSAVWLVLKGADAGQNGATVDSLTRALNRAEKELQLPPPEGADGGYSIPITPSIPLKMSFSILALAYKSAEAELVRTMLRQILPLGESSPDLPLIVPIFGRGRALEVFSAPKINEAAIMGICGYLIGNCSCEVKSQNPGADLFLPVNWPEVVNGDKAGPVTLPPLIVPEVPSRVAASLSTVGAPPEVPVTPTHPVLQSRLMILGAVGLVVVLVGVWIMMRNNR